MHSSRLEHLVLSLSFYLSFPCTWVLLSNWFQECIQSTAKPFMLVSMYFLLASLPPRSLRCFSLHQDFAFLGWKNASEVSSCKSFHVSPSTCPYLVPGFLWPRMLFSSPTPRLLSLLKIHPKLISISPFTPFFHLSLLRTRPPAYFHDFPKSIKMLIM